MSYTLFGRLRGRGRELTATGSRTTPMTAQVETRNAALRVVLTADGTLTCEVGRKAHDTARADRWRQITAINIDTEADRLCH